MADADLTLPGTVATELGVDASDARLPRLIASASAAIAGVLRRNRLHYGSAIVEKVFGSGRSRVVLDVTPIVSVASVVLPDGTSLLSTEYTRESDDAGLLYRASGWPFTGVARGGLPPAADPLVGSETNTITVTYAAGWVTPAQATSAGWAGPARSLPYDIEEACIQLVTNLYRSGGQAANISSESLGDYSVSYADRARIGAMTPGVTELLARYARPEG